MNYDELRPMPSYNFLAYFSGPQTSPNTTPDKQQIGFGKHIFFCGFLIGEEKKEHWNWVGVLFCGRAM